MVTTFSRTLRHLTLASATVVMAVSTTVGFSSHSGAQPPIVTPLGAQTSALSEERLAIHAFEQRVADYVRLHRLLEGPQPTLEVSSDISVVRAAMAALAKRILASRNDARHGDFFTKAVALVFRRRIGSCLTPDDLAAILAAHQDSRAFAPARLRVNAVWPDPIPFTFVPPQLLATLPPLPPELQYRIIGRSLVLWDHHANLIVDILPGAFTT